MDFCYINVVIRGARSADSGALNSAIVVPGDYVIDRECANQAAHSTGVKSRSRSHQGNQLVMK